MNEKLKGIIIPAATPFDERGEVSVPMMEKNYKKWGGTGIRGYMCLGSNGEFKSLTDEESLLVIRNAIRLKGEKTLIVGVGRESLHHTLQFIDRVAALGGGIDYLSVLTPSYFAGLMTDEALYGYYKAVADYSPVPILIYVAPGFANSVIVSPSVLGRLAEHPNICGVKDTSKTMMTSYMVSAGGRDDFSILSGSLGTMMTCLSFGGSGGVVSAANYFPDRCAHLTDLYFAGREKEAFAYYVRLQRVVGRTGARYGLAGLKCCMNLCGFAGGDPRLPVRPLSEEQTAGIRKLLVEKRIIEE